MFSLKCAIFLCKTSQYLNMNIYTYTCINSYIETYTKPFLLKNNFYILIYIYIYSDLFTYNNKFAFIYLYIRICIDILYI